MALTQQWILPVGVGLAVTGIIGLTATFVPESYQGAIVGALFLGTTWFFVWRRDDETVRAHGLALGGLVLPEPIRWQKLLATIGHAFGLAAIFTILFVPYFFGWRAFMHPAAPFSLHMAPKELANEIIGQFLMVALPEEAFYRGFLQTRLEAAFPKRIRIAGAEIGWGLILASLIFAAGHVFPRGPERLVVFFPALLFGWMRAKTKGIGASIAFHATCNLFSLALYRGFHLMK